MKTKEKIYINLKGKSKEELSVLYYFLIRSGEKVSREKDGFLEYSNDEFYSFLVYDTLGWCGVGDISGFKEITIQELKEMLQPISLQQQLEKAEEEVKRLKKEINYKIGNTVSITITEENREELIKLLNNEKL